MFNKNIEKTPIRNRVISVIDEKITRVEEEYVIECDELDEKLKTDKEDLLNAKVKGIVSKFT